MDSGYIYVLINPMLPDLVKIGKTVKSPDERAKELSSSTGVPAPFFVAYQISVNNITEAESYFHQLFSEQRVNDGREFFNTPLHNVIKAMYEYHNSEQSNEYNHRKMEIKQVNSPQKNSSNTLFSTYFIKAEKYNYGLDGEIINKNEALSLYKKAAKLGSLDAYTRIGEIYSHGTDGPRKGVNIDKAKQLFFEGANKGAGACWAELGILAIAEKKQSEADKLFLKYFTSDHWIKNHSENNIEENDYFIRNKHFYSFNYLFFTFTQLLKDYTKWFEDGFEDRHKNGVTLKKDNIIDSKIGKEIKINLDLSCKYFKKLIKKYEKDSSNTWFSGYIDEDQITIPVYEIIEDNIYSWNSWKFNSSNRYLYNQALIAVNDFFEKTFTLDKRLRTEDKKVYKTSFRDIRNTENILSYVLEITATQQLPIKIDELIHITVNYITSSICYLMKHNSILEFNDFYGNFKNQTN
jgi:hypothetical protein